mgnify:CR=1 FL=1
MRRWLNDPRGSGRMIEVDEVLKASGARLAREGGVYLVDSHKTYGSIRDALGKIRAARTEGGEVVADIKIMTPGADLWPSIVDGDIDQFSVGYRPQPGAGRGDTPRAGGRRRRRRARPRRLSFPAFRNRRLT